MRVLHYLSIEQPVAIGCVGGCGRKALISWPSPRDLALTVLRRELADQGWTLAHAMGARAMAAREEESRVTAILCGDCATKRLGLVRGDATPARG